MENQLRTTKPVPIRYEFIRAAGVVSSGSPKAASSATRESQSDLDKQIFATLWATLRSFPEASTAVRNTLNEYLYRENREHERNRYEPA